MEPGEIPITWTADSDALYVYLPNEVSLKIFPLDLSAGRRGPWKQLMPSDQAGITDILRIQIHQTVELTRTVTFVIYLSDPYLVEGLK